MRALALLVATTTSLTFPLDHVAIQDALAIANSSFESDHRRFHADYQFAVGAPPVDFISVVTPFRRVVLSAETAVRNGGRRFGQREALAALQPNPDRVEVYVELTFHPHHMFMAVPVYGIDLEPVLGGGRAVPPLNVVQVPRFAPRFESPWYPYSYPFQQAPRLPGRSESLLGGTLIAFFGAGQLEARGVYAVLVKDGMKELARARLDLSRLR